MRDSGVSRSYRIEIVSYRGLRCGHSVGYNCSMANKLPLPKKELKKKVSIRLNDSTAPLREWLSEHLGINQTAVIELAIRELAAKWGYYK